jgi:hypothetical protein
VKEVNGEKFVHIDSASRKLERLLMGGSISKLSRNAHISKLIKDISQQRDNAFIGHLQQHGVEVPSKKRRFTHKNMKAKLLQVPETCEVKILDRSIIVLCAKPTTALWVQATDESFTLMLESFNNNVNNADTEEAE